LAHDEKNAGRPKKSALKEGIEAVAGLFRAKSPLYEEASQSMALRRLKSILRDSGIDALLSEIGGSKMKIRLLGGLISDREYCAYAVWGLGSIAEKGTDISPALPELLAGLVSEDKNVRCISIRALTSHWLNKGDDASFRVTLSRGDAFMQRDAIETAGSAANSGSRQAMRFLIQLLSDEDEGLRDMSAHGLETAATIGGAHAKAALREELESCRKSSDITNIFEAKTRRRLLRKMDEAESDIKTY
jgi:hypothetical protein